MLCPLSLDPDEANVLTPGYFLIGFPLICTPKYNLEDVPLNRLGRFQISRWKAGSGPGSDVTMLNTERVITTTTISQPLKKNA